MLQAEKKVGETVKEKVEKEIKRFFATDPYKYLSARLTGDASKLGGEELLTFVTEFKEDNNRTYFSAHFLDFIQSLVDHAARENSDERLKTMINDVLPLADALAIQLFSVDQVKSKIGKVPAQDAGVRGHFEGIIQRVTSEMNQESKELENIFSTFLNEVVCVHIRELRGGLLSLRENTLVVKEEWGQKAEDAEKVRRSAETELKEANAKRNEIAIKEKKKTLAEIDQSIAEVDDQLYAVSGQVVCEVTELLNHLEPLYEKKEEELFSGPNADQMWDEMRSRIYNIKTRADVEKGASDGNRAEEEKRYSGEIRKMNAAIGKARTCLFDVMKGKYFHDKQKEARYLLDSLNNIKSLSVACQLSSEYVSNLNDVLNRVRSILDCPLDKVRNEIEEKRSQVVCELKNLYAKPMDGVEGKEEAQLKKACDLLKQAQVNYNSASLFIPSIDPIISFLGCVLDTNQTTEERIANGRSALYDLQGRLDVILQLRMKIPSLKEDTVDYLDQKITDISMRIALHFSLDKLCRRQNVIHLLAFKMQSAQLKKEMVEKSELDKKQQDLLSATKNAPISTLSTLAQSSSSVSVPSASASTQAQSSSSVYMASASVSMQAQSSSSARTLSASPLCTSRSNRPNSQKTVDSGMVSLSTCSAASTSHASSVIATSAYVPNSSSYGSTFGTQSVKVMATSSSIGQKSPSSILSSSSTAILSTLSAHSSGLTATSQTSSRASNSAKANTCAVCLEGEKEYAVIPCGHLSLCQNCAPLFMASANLKSLRVCPICQQDLKGTLRIFFS